MTTDQLAPLIRRPNQESFDFNLYSPGFCFLLDGAGRAVVGQRSEGGITKRFFFRNKSQPIIFVKQLRKPHTIEHWLFEWREGASNVSLKFDATFNIAAFDEVQARGLAEALCHEEDLEVALHEIIDGHLHQALADSFVECTQRNQDILSIFMNQSISGMSEHLNKVVSDAVSIDLGGIPFRIGFALTIDAPFTVELKHKTSFEVQDSRQRRHVESTAFLELQNYQKFRSSRCESKSDVESTIREAIDKAVNRHLFGRPYWEIVSCFDGYKANDTANPTIKDTIENRIEGTAGSIGYRLKIFQTFLDIESLALLKGMRIELPADEVEYQTKNSSGHVRLGLSLDVVAKDFDKLRFLITPDENNIEKAIANEVRRICSDEILSIDRKDFDLEFEASVRGKISQKVAAVLLESHGLLSENVRVFPAKTVEAQRFEAIRGKTKQFELTISPQADGGSGDSVTIFSAFEIVAMIEGGWEKFEGKDFGYRSDSNYWNAESEKQIVARLGKSLDKADQIEIDRERRAVAVERELTEIQVRIESVLTSELQHFPQLSETIRNRDQKTVVHKMAEKIAQQAIHDEFGLVIELRGFRRLDTETDVSRQLEHNINHRLIRDDIKKSSDHEMTQRSTARGAELEYINDLRAKKNDLQLQIDQTDGDAIAEAELTEVNRKLEAFLGTSERQELSVEKARGKILKPVQSTDDFYDNLRAKLSHNESGPRLTDDSMGESISEDPED